MDRDVAYLTPHSLSALKRLINVINIEHIGSKFMTQVDIYLEWTHCLR